MLCRILSKDAPNQKISKFHQFATIQHYSNWWRIGVTKLFPLYIWLSTSASGDHDLKKRCQYHFKNISPSSCLPKSLQRLAELDSFMNLTGMTNRLETTLIKISSDSHWLDVAGIWEYKGAAVPLEGCRDIHPILGLGFGPEHGQWTTLY